MLHYLRWIGLSLFVGYFALWGSLTTFPVFVVAVFLGATVIHEISHCVIARIWTTNCDIEWEISLSPGTAIFKSPYDIPPDKFKYVGAAPLLFSIIGSMIAIFLNILGFGPVSYTVLIVVGVSGGLLASLSPSDEFTILHPSAFQEYAAEHDEFDLERAERYLE